MKRFRILPATMAFVLSSLVASSLWGVSLGVYAATDEYAWPFIVGAYIAIGFMFWHLRKIRGEVKQRKAEGCWEKCPHV